MPSAPNPSGAPESIVTRDLSKLDFGGDSPPSPEKKVWILPKLFGQITFFTVYYLLPIPSLPSKKIKFPLPISRSVDNGLIVTVIYVIIARKLIVNTASFSCRLKDQFFGVTAI